MDSALTTDVIGHIRSWKPTKEYKRKFRYKRDLLHHLRHALHADHHLFGRHHDQVLVRSEHSIIDISINHRIGIDVQLTKNSVAHLQKIEKRLQIYLKHYDVVLLVIVGGINEAQTQELQNLLKAMNKRHSEWSSRIAMIIK